MGFSYFNPNPEWKQVGDCTVRAIARATGQSWDATYIGLCLQGLIMGDMPSANSVWSAYLPILRDGVFFYASRLAPVKKILNRNIEIVCNLFDFVWTGRVVIPLCH